MTRLVKTPPFKTPATLLTILLTVATIGGCSSGPSSEQSRNEGPEADYKREPIAVELVSSEGADSLVFAQPDVAMMRHRVAPVAGFFAPPATIPVNSEKYQHYPENGVKLTSNEPVSTFSVDVDTGSYSNVRRMLVQGHLPPSDAVRVEEFINYFDYQYDLPEENGRPFDINTDLVVSPWNQERHLLRVALQGAKPESELEKPANLVFLVDVSGSMNAPDKLPLLKKSLSLLIRQMDAQDRLSLVVYAGASGVVLEPTSGDQKAKIDQALNQLQAGGSTNGQAGIQLAYSLAKQAYIDGGINRVILATDGDFNVGMVDQSQLIELIKQHKRSGIALTTLGFGQGNYNDHLMEQLADEGDGSYAYIDNLNEGRKVLVDEMASTLITLAKDVKIQVEFNPEHVAEYRLIGYENRALNREDFNNDKVDAGEVGAGHTVTALYELTLVDSEDKFMEPLRYAAPKAEVAKSSELAQVKLRYKPLEQSASQLLSKIVYRNDVADLATQSVDFRFAVAVAGFAQRLKNGKFVENLDYQSILDLAHSAKGEDPFGYRSEFVQLVRTAMTLDQPLEPLASEPLIEPKVELAALVREFEQQGDKRIRAFQE